MVELINRLPPYLHASIYLPTDRVPPDRAAAGLTRVLQVYEWALDEIYRPRLRALRAARRSRRCFIIGNGPSLKETDLSKLRGEVTFAVNGFFLLMPELDWHPTFYVVEDHLVAEDRAEELNALRGPTKLFPASLAYVLEPDNHTVFFDHRPRVSFPHGFDFSFEADINTYTGGTVTYTCLQLAAYLGYEEIYLIGVDASYSIPADAALSGPGRVKEIDMGSDDPNHFHPDYFGKGKRWHEPNVDVMLGAYEAARQACAVRAITIRNATVGGKLEVFPRVAYDSLFMQEAAAPAVERPRVLLIDHTRVGDGTATGELKSALFAGWPADRLLQLHQRGHGDLFLYQLPDQVDGPLLFDDVAARVNAFRPDLIVYRPVPRTENLHAAAMKLIERSDRPVVAWIVDDWPAAYAEQEPERFHQLDHDWRWLIDRATRHYAISGAMATAFRERYGVPFEIYANGVELHEWPPAKPREPGPLSLRYAGGLADNMNLATVVDVAETVERLAASGMDVRFEIKTRDVWHKKSGAAFAGLSRTTFLLEDLPAQEYRAWLRAADIVLIAYNFDESSTKYVQYSLANKLPECLASGAALMAIGPGDLPTIALLDQFDIGVRIKVPSADDIRAAIEYLEKPERRLRLARDAQGFAFGMFDLDAIRQRFARSIESVAREPVRLVPPRAFERAPPLATAQQGESQASPAAVASEVAIEAAPSASSADPQVAPESAASYSTTTGAVTRPSAMPRKPPAYAPFGDWLKPRAPRLYRLLQLTRRSAADVWQRRAWTIPALLLPALIAISALLPAMAPHRGTILVLSLVTLLGEAIAYVALRLRETAAGAVARVDRRLTRFERQLGRLERDLAEARTEARTQSRGAAAQAQAIGAQVLALNSRLAEEVNGMREDQAMSDRKLADELASVRADIDARYHALSSRIPVRQDDGEIADRVERLASGVAELGGLRAEVKEHSSRLGRLQERVVATERQVGELRYPDAPRVMAFFGHHKCGSRFFIRQVFARIAEMTEAPIRQFEIRDEPFRYERMDDLDLQNLDLSGLGERGRELVLFYNGTGRSIAELDQATDDWRGLRVVRDPRQVLVSSYLHHRGNHSVARDGWEWQTLGRDQPILRQLAEEEGIIYELDSITKQVIETQILGPFDDPRVLTLKLEDFADDPRPCLMRIAEFLQVADVAGIDLARTNANPDSAPWQLYFTPRITTLFKERYGQALIDLGYEKDLDW